MSNQRQAHVADERAACEKQWKISYGDKDFDSLGYRYWMGWQARAAIPAGANVASGEPLQWALLNLNNRIVYQHDSRANVEMNQPYVKTPTRIVGLVEQNSSLAAGAPAETPKPLGFITNEALAILRYAKSTVVSVVSAPWQSSSNPIYAAQPAPAPATDARDLTPKPDEHDYWIARYEEADAEVLARLIEAGDVSRNKVVALRREIRPIVASWYFSPEVHAHIKSEKALGFADEIITAVLTQGADFDGGHLQQMALEHGLLRVEEMAEPCGENCACANDGVPFWPAMCYRKTYRAAMLSANSPREAG